MANCSSKALDKASTAFKVLATLGKADDPITTTEIMQRIKGSLFETIRSSAARLQTKGLAMRVGPSTWRITEQGREVLAGRAVIHHFRGPTVQEKEDRLKPPPPWVHPIRARILTPTRITP